MIIDADTTDPAYTNSMLVPGGYTKFSVTAVTSSYIAAQTTFQVTFQPEHDIPPTN
jgi:hypothetical protein